MGLCLCIQQFCLQVFGQQPVYSFAVIGHAKLVLFLEFKMFPGYTEYVRACKSGKVNSFEDLRSLMSSEVRNVLLIECLCKKCNNNWATHLTTPQDFIEKYCFGSYNYFFAYSKYSMLNFKLEHPKIGIHYSGYHFLIPFKNKNFSLVFQYN